MRLVVITLCVLLAAAACNQPAAPPATNSTPAEKKLGIRPAGDTELVPDMSQVPPDLQKVFAHIDENIDAHVGTCRSGFASRASRTRAKAFRSPPKW